MLESYLTSLPAMTTSEVQALFLGACVEVLEPAELRESIRAAIGDLAALYRPPPIAAEEWRQ